MSDHHDHHLPPPEPDRIEALGITFWGLVSFASVFLVVVGLYDYFWIEREDAEGRHIESYTDTTLIEYQAREAADKLSSYTPLIAVVNGTMVEGYYTSEVSAKRAVIDGSVEDINTRRIINVNQVQRTRIPIERAMELVIAERARPMTKPAPIAKKPQASAGSTASLEEKQLEPTPEPVEQDRVQ